jgi:hypothetical protein
MDPTLRLHPGQAKLTPEQEVEVFCFAEAYIRAQLSTEPADEREAEALLRQAYAVAGLAAPRHVQWVDGPCQLIAVWDPEGIWGGGSPEPVMRDDHWDTILASDLENVWKRVYLEGRARVLASLKSTFPKGHPDWPGHTNIPSTIRGLVLLAPHSGRLRLWLSNPALNIADYRFWWRARRSVCDAVWASLLQPAVDYDLQHDDWNPHRGRGAEPSARASMRAYGGDITADGGDVLDLASFAFFDTYFAPNDLHGLARFNQMVSGYWLGKEVAVIVRRPKHLSFDEAGRLHNTTGKCMEYHDGWGLWAWHGVQVSEKVILAPEALTRDDFLTERSLEVRRVIQERMGSRFVRELGGQVIESGPRGTLYEVALPSDDPERVAHYVQVQDASTARQYFVRVPPTIETAAEAVAWSFQMTGEEYGPAQET